MGVVGEDHRQRMGEAIWLFMWIVGRQTGQLKNGTGIVNYGKPLTYGVICADTGYPRDTAKKWMFCLIREKYVRQELQPNNEFVLWVLNAKKYPIAKQFSTGNPQRVGPNMVLGSDQVWSEGRTKYGVGSPPKYKKEYGFIGSLNKESTKVSTTVLRASPAIPIGVNKMDEKPEAKTVVPSLAALASKSVIPRDKSARELDAERRRQLDELAAKDKIPRIKTTPSNLTLEEQKAELKKRGFLP